MCQRSLYNKESHANTLGHRRVVTKAAVFAESVSDESSMWQWRKAQLCKIGMFAGPALSIPLADPIMSLVDTVCIGQYTGTLELAALGPTMLIFNLFTYVFTAITITTVSLVADKLRTQDVDGAGDALSSALFVATTFGLIIQAVLLCCSEQMVMFTGAAPALLAPSVTYLKIRAWSAPAVLISMVAQAGLLAQQDAFAPFIWVAVQSILNVIGDLVLIKHFQQGLTGAAWATVLSQLIGTVGLIWMLRFRGQVRPRPQIPTLQQLQELSSTFGPASLIYVFKCLCYMLLQGSATALKPALVAAHQVLWQVWNLCAFGHVPLEQAALAFLPGIQNRQEYTEWVKLLAGVGLFVGVVTALLATGVPYYLPFLFTPDVQLWPIMKSIAPQCAISMVLCALDVSASGILMASKDLLFLARAMAISFTAVVIYFKAITGQGWQLGGTWWGLCLFFCIRAVQSCHHLYSSQQSAQQMHTISGFESDKLRAVAITAEASG